MEYFNPHIPPLIMALLGGALLFALLSALVGMMPMRRVARRGRRLMKEGAQTPGVADDDLPSVSVVVYAHNAGDGLRSLIEKLEHQDYPRFDIIVVNDGSTDMTREIVDNMRQEYDNLKYTFVSETARNVSHVKVAYTLGIKASDNDVTVTTSAGCHPVSDRWLRLLCAPLADSAVDLSLGYSFVDRDRIRGLSRWTHTFDSVVTASQWLGHAIGGCAFRGDQYNMAFRRSVFFGNKGYAASTALRSGHDDIFVNNISDGSNTAVVLHPDSHVELDWETGQVKRLYNDDRERRIFMSRFLHTGAFRLQGFNTLCLWLTLGCVAAAAVLSLPNLFAAATGALMLILLWGYQICLFRRTARLLRAVRLWWSVPPLWILRPFASAARRQRANSGTARHYTWSVGMKP